jgi:hypothetical protein
MCISSCLAPRKTGSSRGLFRHRARHTSRLGERGPDPLSRPSMKQSAPPLRGGLRHPIAAGELLIEARRLQPHGGWLRWLEANCQIPERTAQAYMRLARHLGKLGPEYAQRVAECSRRPQVLAATHGKRGPEAAGEIWDEHRAESFAERYGRRAGFGIPADALETCASSSSVTSGRSLGSERDRPSWDACATRY